MNFLRRIISRAYDWTGQRKPGMNEFEIAVLLHALYRHADTVIRERAEQGIAPTLAQITSLKKIAKADRMVMNITNEFSHVVFRETVHVWDFEDAVHAASKRLLHYVFDQNENMARLGHEGNGEEINRLNTAIWNSFTNASQPLHDTQGIVYDEKIFGTPEGYVAYGAEMLINTIHFYPEWDDWWVRNVTEKIPSVVHGETIQYTSSNVNKFLKTALKRSYG